MCPSAKCLIEIIITFPPSVNVYTDSGCARQPVICTSTSGGIVQWRNATFSAWSRRQQSLSLSSTEGGLNALATGIADGMVTKHLLRELGYEVALVSHVESQSAKAWASKRGSGRMKHVMKYMFGQDVVQRSKRLLPMSTRSRTKQT